MRQPPNRIAMTEDEACKLAHEIGFPILLRPSFVLGGRGMLIVYEMAELKEFAHVAFSAAPGKPVLLDKFLENAIEIDVDCLCDGERTVIGGMLEHIEFAGVHSGDAAMVMPPRLLKTNQIEQLREASYALAIALNVRGLMNIQFAFQGGDLYVLEVNPRASRTVPFIAKAIGVPLADYAARIMVGEKLSDIGFTQEVLPPCWAVKEAVFPFSKFPGAPVILSPEMRSTGEVMGMDSDLGIAYAKTQIAAKPPLPTEGNIFLSLKDEDKPRGVEVARQFVELGFHLYSTANTAAFLEKHGIPVKKLFRLSDGARPHVVDMIKNGDMQMIINTPQGMVPRLDENKIRTEAVAHGVLIKPTIAGAHAALLGIKSLKTRGLRVKSIQDYHRLIGETAMT